MNFLVSNGITTRPFYNIPQDKFQQLQNDAIKISGKDLNIISLKNYLALSSFDQEVIFFRNKKIQYYIIDNSIVNVESIFLKS